ncbi:MAG: orange carotenoid protein [Drouetiella hepatica Uher 2000/2452]|uniref:Orange carotenoid protein n=1 Tax=Drouetiella hepatica Uher 2000/2452 TaxID=904376 RepID=A0A951QD42_9CYAN|nr:orange carotenoid protein [Drouetiella hepatica Uher 2000/2452]
MSSDSNTQLFSEATHDVFKTYSSLDTDAKLALLYYVYEKMGKSITPAAPAAADPELAPLLLGDFFKLSGEDQLAIMREVVNGEDTEYSQAYGALAPNNQLLVWYAWAQGMGKTVIDMPGNYQPVKSIADSLAQIEKLEFQEQISLLRQIATEMGHSNVQPIPTQAETGKTSSL